MDICDITVHYRAVAVSSVKERKQICSASMRISQLLSGDEAGMRMAGRFGTLREPHHSTDSYLDRLTTSVYSNKLIQRQVGLARQHHQPPERVTTCSEPT